MLNAGSLVGDSLSTGSMARAIEDAMVALGVVKLEDETPDAAESRRKAFLGIATGVVNHIVANLDITIAAGKFGNAPAVATHLTGATGDIA